MRIPLAALLLVALALAGCQGRDRGDGPVPTGTSEIRTLHPGAIDRTYILHAPPQATNETALPLLVMLHGGFGTAAHMQSRYGMDPVADELGFYVAYPDGAAFAWDAVHCCGLPFAYQVDDVGFLAAVIADVAARHAVDAERVCVAGHSNGGMMAYRFAAERSDLVACAAVVAGTIGGRPAPDEPVRMPDAPRHHVSVLHIHATDDPQVPYDGGKSPSNYDGRSDLSVNATHAFWLAANGLDGPSQRWTEGNVSYERSVGDGVEVLFATTVGGHGWPGTTAEVPGLIDVPARPNATRAVAEFFLAHGRPVPAPAPA